ncbi:dimethylsulfonioproprionate lyase family protein [Termitidicoccus mucosus]|uniref:Cupin 2 conserved barrel domain-containing protein n=1 Tax=Termitidicoccus mucosus TaxID=1184151 RepID=A0A178INQ9_9BACT|nr:hypothetical protein AW736_03340 [Opitutaceae bacterium TSB47]
MPSSTKPVPLSRAVTAIDVLRRHFECQIAIEADTDPMLSRELAGVLESLGAVDYRDGFLQPGAHPVARQFADPPHSADGTVVDALAAFLPLGEALPWRYGYTPRPDLPGLESRMAWAELVGPEAPFHSDRVCLGLTFIGPRVRYPEHAHPAVEVYFVLSGTALWTADGVTHPRPPGSFILHPSNVVHVMETRDEPLLAAYTWSGDVRSPSVYTP